MTNKLKMAAQVNNTTISKIYNKAVNDKLLIALPTASYNYILMQFWAILPSCREISKMLDGTGSPSKSISLFI